MLKYAVTALLLVALMLRWALTPAQSHGSPQAELAALADAMQVEYHDCVPLGWQPVPVAGTYYPGFTASLATRAEFFDSVWRGRIERPQLKRPDVRSVFTVLNRLTAAGLLTRQPRANGFDYYLTQSAMPYYYSSSIYGDNREHFPYLCYTHIVPQRVLWSQRSAGHAHWTGPHAQWYRVAFTWRAGQAARWAGDPVLRSHSVVLPPVKCPTFAMMLYVNGEWDVTKIYDRTWGMPVLAGT